MNRVVSTLLAAVVALLTASCQNVPITGRSQLQLFGEGAEIHLGLTAYEEVLRKVKISKDPALNDLVTRVGKRIAAATGKTDYSWEFKVIDNDKLINAFCMPGGKVAVYTGILPVTVDEDGLATVLGHEVAHAIARHAGERLSEYALVGGAVAVLAAGTARDAGQANRNVVLLGALATGAVLLPHSRDQESEADRLGLIYMAKAGYDPRTAPAFWRRMSQAAKGKAKSPEFLSTHPADDTRIRRIEQWLPEALSYYRPAD
jgi:predicted Zn-dependent protease